MNEKNMKANCYLQKLDKSVCEHLELNRRQLQLWLTMVQTWKMQSRPWKLDWKYHRSKVFVPRQSIWLHALKSPIKHHTLSKAYNLMEGIQRLRCWSKLRHSGIPHALCLNGWASEQVDVKRVLKWPRRYNWHQRVSFRHDRQQVNNWQLTKDLFPLLQPMKIITNIVNKLSKHGTYLPFTKNYL